MLSTTMGLAIEDEVLDNDDTVLDKVAPRGVFLKEIVLPTLRVALLAALWYQTV